MYRFAYHGSALLLTALLIVGTSTVEASTVPAPTGVGAAGPGKAEHHQPEIDGNGEPVEDPLGGYETEVVEIPAGATKVEDKTTEPMGGHQGGEIIRKFRNDSKSDWQDFHIYIPRQGVRWSDGKVRPVRISGIEATGSNSATEGVDVPGNTGNSGVQVPKGGGGGGTITNPSERDADGDVTNPNESTVTISIVIEYWDEEDKEWKRVKGTPVTYYVWGTHGQDRNVWISAALPDELGSGDGRVALATVFAGFNPTPLPISDTEPGPVELNHISLCETDGHRFQNGTVVIMPGQGTRFVMNADTRIRAFSENGDEITGSEMLSTSNMRIDRDGNFVFDISRAQDDEFHAAFVVTGLQLGGLPKIMWEGHELTAGVGGAVLAGRCFADVWKLAVVE